MAPGAPPDTADETLMLQYAAGQAEAFDRLYSRHKGAVYRYFLRQVRSAGQADELAQDVWMNVIRAREGYQVTAKFTTYLFRLAHNRLIDHIRHLKSAGVSVSLDEEGDDGEAALALPDDVRRQPEVRASSVQIGTRLIAAVESLPAPQREAFLLHEEGGLGIAEIAAATGVGTETAKSRLRYAIAKLRAELADLVE